MNYNTPSIVWGHIKKELCRQNPKVGYFHILIILASQKRTFGRFDLNPSEYTKITKKQLHKGKQQIHKIESGLKNLNWDLSSKSLYTKVPAWFLRISLKNLFQLKVAHYLISNQNMGAKSHKFAVFCDQYAIANTRQNKHKFNKIIKNILDKS